MKELFPFKNNYLDLNGLNYHYIDEGEGEPVVMVHGNPTWSFYYRNLIGALKDRYRVIVPDHMGCGLSDKPRDSQYAYRLKQRADDLEALLDHLQIKEKITLIVHDWGGMIGCAYGVRWPERIKRFVILNTSAFHLPQSKPFPLALWICRNTMLGALLVRGCNAFARIASHVCVKRNKMSKELRNAYCAPYNSWKNRIATLRFVQDIPLKPRDPSYDLVTEVDQGMERFKEHPMLICWGMKDFVFDKHFYEEWKRRMPQAIFHSFEDCGHYILEDAKEDVIPIIQEFLKSCDD